jgi:hypothetical protein
MTEPHTHRNGDELLVFWVPADTDQPMELKVIRNDLDHIQALVGGYVTPVLRAEVPELPCGCDLVMLCDEEGEMKRSDQNVRAQSVFPHPYDLRGDVVFLGEGLVGTAKDAEPGWFGLPPYFINWEGPGSPIPTPKQPWES